MTDIMGLLDIALVAGAIAWITTAMVGKDGPFRMLATFKQWVKNKLGPNSPLECYHCASFWIGLAIVIAYAADPVVVRPMVHLFGVIGIAQALRGASGEF